MTRAELPERLETERLVLRVRTVADVVDIFDYASRPEVSYPAGFPPVKTLEDEIYYLEHILPERNEKDTLLISLVVTRMMSWRLAISYIQTIGV